MLTVFPSYPSLIRSFVYITHACGFCCHVQPGGSVPNGVPTAHSDSRGVENQWPKGLSGCRLLPPLPAGPHIQGRGMGLLPTY